MQPQSSSSGASSSSRAGGPSGPTSGSQDIPISSTTSRTAAEIGEQPPTHAAATMGEKVRSGVDRATESMSQAAREAQETAAKAGHYVKDEAASMAEQQKEAAAKQMTHMSQAIRRAADKLHAEEDHRIAGYAERAASQMESASRYLAEHNLPEMVEHAEDFARRHSAVVCGGMFIAGVALARFLKASRPERVQYAPMSSRPIGRPTDWQQRQAVHTGI